MIRRMILPAFWLAAVSHASAAETKADSSLSMNFLEVLVKGGYMMYPLGLMSMITVILILIFLLTIRRNAIISDRFMDTAEAMIRKANFISLITFCHRRNECMARITQKTLDFMSSNPTMPFENVREVAQTEGSRQAGMLTSRITYLADIGAIAPMVGLLGTVIGMIKAFIEISSGGKQGVREMGLAEGVSEALIATAGGLAISIVALAFYSFFRGRLHKYISELEAGATHLIALLHAEYERQSLAQAPRSGTEPSRDHLQPPTFAGERRDLQGV